MKSNIKINKQRLIDSIEEMAKIGKTPKGGVNRQALTDLDKISRDLFINWCKKENLLWLPPATMTSKFLSIFLQILYAAARSEVSSFMPMMLSCFAILLINFDEKSYNPPLPRRMYIP